MAIFGPAFLVSKIHVFAYVTSAVLLVIFSDTINRYVVFPVADLVRDKTKHHLRHHVSFSEGLAKIMGTIIVIAYCYFGSFVLAEYIFKPIFTNARNWLVLILLGIFLLISYIINEERDTFMKY